MTDYPNVPRKKAKFFNFIRNSFRSFNLNQSQLEEIWNVIESFDKADKNTNGNNLKRKLEDSVEQDEKNEKEIKKPKDGDVNEDKSSDDFDWIEVLKKECIKHQYCSVSFEKLEKKVFEFFCLDLLNTLQVICFEFYWNSILLWFCFLRCLKNTKNSNQMKMSKMKR